MDLTDSCKIKGARLEPSPGTLYIVGTPIGNLGDLSPRAQSLLKNVSLIACEDTRRSGQLLKIIDAKAPLLSYHKHNVKSRLVQLLEILKSNGSIALISDAGLPGISDPGEELVHASKLNNYEVICIPGPCAAITALVASGLPSNRFCFEGFFRNGGALLLLLIAILLLFIMLLIRLLVLLLLLLLLLLFNRIIGTLNIRPAFSIRNNVRLFTTF